MFKDKRLNAQKIAQWNEAAKRLTRQSLVENSIPDDPQSHWVWVRNDSGSARERYDCMALSDPIFSLDLDGSVDLMFKAIASAADKTPVILLEPIDNGAMGKGIIHGLALAKVGSGSTTATQATPGTNKLTPGTGSIKLLGAPSASVDTLLPVLLGSAGGGSLFKATMKEAWTSGIAECDIYSIDGTTFTDTGIDADVYDGLSIFASLTTGNSLYALLQAGKYYAVQAPCP